jgi:transaldolase
VYLVAPGTVNTMPTKTMNAVADHGEIAGDQVTGSYEEAGNVLDALERLGISYADVTTVLEAEGVDKFATSWAELLGTVQTQLTKAAL